MSATEPGTLMWIGPTCGAFAEAYEYCLENSAQLARRHHCEQALDRRAAGVRGIVLARNNRAPISLQSLSHLRRRYSAAEFTHLLGPLALGLRSGEDLPSSERMAWHRWNEVLPHWLKRWGAATSEQTKPSRSVLIIASHYQAAEPLTDLAASTGAATAWLTSPDCLPFQNFDSVWWDDSTAAPASTATWQGRLQRFGNAAEHAWIVNNPTADQARIAHLAGVDRILIKPHQIDGLLQGLNRQTVPAKLRAA
jgi:hypothetical protein